MARVPTTQQQLPAGLALPVAAIAILRRPLRDPGVILFVVVVLLSSQALSSIPRYATHVSNDGLRQVVQDAPIQQSGVSVIIEDRLGRSVTGDSFADLAQRGETYRQQLPPVLRDALDPGSYLVETPRFLSIDTSGQPLGTVIRIRYQRDLWEHISLVAGREPAPRQPLPPSEALGSALADDKPLPVFEIALTTETAELLGLGLNDRLLLEPSASNNLTPTPFGSESGPVRVIMEVVGLIAVDHPDDPVWFGETGLQQPDVSSQGDRVQIAASAVAAWDEAVYTDLYRHTLVSTRQAYPWTYSWRFPVDSAGVETGTLGTLSQDLGNLETTRGPLPALFNDPDEARVVTGLDTIIDSIREQRRVFTITIVLAGVGLLALTLAAISLVATLLTQRRRASHLLLRGRGATGRQLVAAQLTEAILLGLPATCAGVLLGHAVFGGVTNSQSLIAAAVVALVAVVLLVAAILPITRPPLGALSSEPGHGRRADTQRLVIEATTIILAIVGVILIRRRGLDSGVDGSGIAVDPYLAAVPVLIGVAVSLLTVRLAPYPLGALASIAPSRRDFVPFVALHRASSQPVGGSLPTIALLVAVAISVFMLIVSSTIEHARDIDAGLTTVSSDIVDSDPADNTAIETPIIAGDERGDTPFASGIVGSFRLTALMAVTYAVFGAIIVQVMSAQVRARDSSVLRTLGLSRRQALALAVAEQLPLTAIVSSIGALMGVSIAWLVEPGLPLAVFAGLASDQAVPLSVNWPLIVSMTFTIVLVVTAATCLFTLIARRAHISRIMRAGE